KLSDAEYSKRLKDFIQKDFNPSLIPLLKDRAKTLVEAKEMLEGELDFIDSVSFSPELLIQGSKVEGSAVKNNLEKVLEMLKSADEAFTSENVKEIIFPYATEQGRASVLWPMRIALSGKEKSPDPFTLAGLLGKEKTLERIEKAAKML